MKSYSPSAATLDQWTSPIWALTAAGAGALALREAIEYREYEAAMYFVLHLVAAVLFLVRHPPRAVSKDPVAILVVGLAQVYLYLYDVTVPAAGWTYSVGLLATQLGIVLAIASLQSLGRFFAVLPSARGLKTSGLHGLVRHPLYAAYTVMDAGIVLSFPTWRNALLLALWCALMSMRIRYEERVLTREFPEYEEYARRVRYRLVPGLA